MSCELLKWYTAIEEGNMQALKSLYPNLEDFPNLPSSDGLCGEMPLDYAIYHGPLTFVEALLREGADPNYDDGGGFPSLFAALSAHQPDRLERLRLLLEAGADPAQRGANDFTLLHYAAAMDDDEAIRILRQAGCSLEERTRIDNYETPLELAERNGRTKAIAALRVSD